MMLGKIYFREQVTAIQATSSYKTYVLIPDRAVCSIRGDKTQGREGRNGNGEGGDVGK